MSSRRLPQQPQENAWSAALRRRRERGAGVLDLTESNPTHVGLSPLAEAAEALARVGPVRYDPDARGLLSAREAVAAQLSADGVRAAVETLLLTASTSESYAHLFRLLADPGEAVLAPVPSYPLIAPLARAEGLEVRPYTLRFDGRWHLDRESLSRVAACARAVVLVEPNHPTGSCLDAADREFVEALAEREGLAIVSDEVFAPFPREGCGPLPTWRGPRRVPTFVLGGLSKWCGLPHLKLGWIVTGGPERARAEAMAGLEWLADLSLSVASPVQHALPRLLELGAPFQARVAARIRANLATLEKLARERPQCSVLPADGGWSALLRLPAARTDEEWALALLERGVALHPGHFYDLAQGEYLVASLIAAPADFARGIEALAAELGAP